MNIGSLVDIIQTIGGIGAIFGALWFLVNWNSKRKAEKASADLAEADADGKVGDNWRSFAESLQHEINSLKERFEEERTKRDEERRKMDEERKAWDEERTANQETIAALKHEIKRLEGVITMMEHKFGITSAEVANG